MVAIFLLYRFMVIKRIVRHIDEIHPLKASTVVDVRIFRYKALNPSRPLCRYRLGKRAKIQVPLLRNSGDLNFWKSSIRRQIAAAIAARAAKLSRLLSNLSLVIDGISLSASFRYQSGHTFPRYRFKMR
jgi:hypothetical protein